MKYILLLTVISGLVLFLIRKYKKTHDPNDFRLRIIPSWFSKKYAAFSYTANNGFTWNNVQSAKRPILDDDNWEMEDFIINVEGQIGFWKEKFSTYQKILDFENEERNRVQSGNEKLEAKRKAFEQRIKQVYNQNQLR